MASADVGDHFALSPKTVEHHMGALRRKCGRTSPRLFRFEIREAYYAELYGRAVA